MSWLRTSVDRAVTQQNAVAPNQTAAVAVLERPPVPISKPLAAVDTALMSAAQVADYRKTCEEIGVDPQDIVVEEFRHFLAANDFPTFNLQTVVSYMDDLTAKDNPTGFGWHWCPVRPKDSAVAMAWGRPSEHRRGGIFTGLGDGREPERKVPASDFYQSHGFKHGDDSWGWSGGMVMGERDGARSVPTQAEIMQAEIDGRFQRHATIRAFWNSPAPAYTRTIPLHALKKIATIEREFKHKVVFLVTEYTTRAHVVINPDPFLMAVIPNTAVSHGKGRFIIDVWDEPGFGIDKMLK